MDRGERSRTNSSSSVRSPVPPATPSDTNTPSSSTTSRSSSLHHTPGYRNPHPDQLIAGVSRLASGSRRSVNFEETGSIPPTPAPTPNPLLHVTYHMVPEQLAAGIDSLKTDEGYVDSSSFPATPAPSPFSPSPAQFSRVTPDQVAEGIKRLRDEGGVSGASTGQPPTPSTTPGHGVVLGAAAANPALVIPERLAESINHLRTTDEGLESGSNPATPIPTPISPSPATHRTQFLPEQLAAGIHRLKFEEGMSSGGSSAGFPSTPAPTPFAQHSGAGVRPEDLAAGISRLSVIEESVDQIPINVVEASPQKTSQPELSQYFGNETASEVEKDSSAFFDGIEDKTPDDDAMLHSCRESRVDLVSLEKTPLGNSNSMSEAKIDVLEQKFDDESSLVKRQTSNDHARKSSHASSEEPSVCTLFNPDETREEKQSDPFDTIGIQDQSGQVEISKPEEKPTSLDIKTEDLEGSNSDYSTPIAPTPNMELGYSTHLQSTPVSASSQFLTSRFQSSNPITSPLPNSAPIPAPPNPMLLESQLSCSSVDEGLILPDEPLPETDDFQSVRRNYVWLPRPATAQILHSMGGSTPGTFYPDRESLTMPGIAVREDFADPVTNLVLHYRGEAEAAKRQTLTANSVTRDPRGLRQLIRAGCLRAALNLTARLLQMYNQGPGQTGSLSKHTPSSLQIWFTRIALLVKLRQFSIAEVEAEPFGDLDRPDLYFEYYPDMYPMRKGSMVPFAFRLLLAELPQHLGKQQDALDRLYALLKTVQQILANLNSGRSEDGTESTLTEEDRQESLDLWRRRRLRIHYSIANCAIVHKDFELAINTLDILLEMEEEKKKAVLRSATGRVYLQIGDLEKARSCFSQAYKLRGDNTLTANKCDGFLDMAMLSIANGDYQNALESLLEAHKLCPDNAGVINNISVCYLYLGRLKEGLSFLESNVTANPAVLLQETSILNLCTLYELESSYAGQKKRALLDLVSQYNGDGINVACLGLQT